MIQIKKLNNSDFKLVENFIILEKENFKFISKLGWSDKNIQLQLIKKNNLSIGFFDKNELIGILIAETIQQLKNLDLEIHIIYISHKKRRKNAASKLLNYFEVNKKNLNLNNIYLEVAENNLPAIKLYEKNDFVFLKFRHNYYKYNNKMISAKCYLKKL